MLFALFFLASLLSAAVPNDDTVKYVQKGSDDEPDQCGEPERPCYRIQKVLQDELAFDKQIIVYVKKPTNDGDYYRELTTNINNGRATVIGDSGDDVIITGADTRTDALFAVSNGRITLDTLSLKPNPIGQKALIYMDGIGDVNLYDVHIKNFDLPFNYSLIEATAGRILLQNSYFDNLRLTQQSLIRTHTGVTALTILTCEFFNSSNIGSSGSILTADVGIYTTIQFISSLFSGSSSSGNGGACVFNGVDSPVTSDLIIENCQFIQNSGTNGGALYFTKKFYSFQFLYNSFENNVALSLGNDIYWEGNDNIDAVLINKDKVDGSFSTSLAPKVQIIPYQGSEKYDKLVFSEKSATKSIIIKKGEDIDTEIGDISDTEIGDISDTEIKFKSLLLEDANYAMKGRTIDTYGISITGSSQQVSFLSRNQTDPDPKPDQPPPIHHKFFFQISGELGKKKNGILRLSSLTITRSEEDDKGEGFIELTGGELRLQRVSIIVKLVDVPKHAFKTPHVIEYGFRKNGKAVINGARFTDAVFDKSAAVKKTGEQNNLQIENSFFINLSDLSDAGGAIDIDQYQTSVKQYKSIISNTLFQNCKSGLSGLKIEEGFGAGAISINFNESKNSLSAGTSTNSQQNAGSVPTEPVEIISCQFENNEGYYAGAISVTGNIPASSNFNIKYCTFKNNTGIGYSHHRGNDVLFEGPTYEDLLIGTDERIFVSSKTTSEEPQIYVNGGSYSDKFHEALRNFFVDLTVGFIGDDDRDNYGRGGPDEPYLTEKKALDMSKDHKTIRRSIRIQRGTYEIENITLDQRTIDIIGDSDSDSDWNDRILRTTNVLENTSAINVLDAEVSIQKLVILAFLPRRSGNSSLIKLNHTLASLKLEKVEIRDPQDPSDKHITFDQPLIQAYKGYSLQLIEVYINDLTFLNAAAINISDLNQAKIDKSKFINLQRRTDPDAHIDFKLNGSVLEANYSEAEKRGLIPTLTITDTDFEGNYVIPPPKNGTSEGTPTEIKAHTNKPVNVDEPEPEETCGWSESAVSIFGGITDISGTNFTKFTQGAIYIKNGSLNILPTTTFDYNFGPNSDVNHPNLGRNIICDGELTKIQGTDYPIPDTHIHADPASFLEKGELSESYWILRRGECKIDGGLSNSASYLFKPTITDVAVGLVGKKKNQKLNLNISGTHFEKCSDLMPKTANDNEDAPPYLGAGLLGFEIIEDRYQNDDKKAATTGLHFDTIPAYNDSLKNDQFYGEFIGSNKLQIHNLDKSKLKEEKNWVTRITYGKDGSRGKTLGLHVYGSTGEDVDPGQKYSKLTRTGLILIIVFAAIAFILLVILTILGIFWVLRVNEQQRQKEEAAEEQKRYSTLDSFFSQEHDGGHTEELESYKAREADKDTNELTDSEPFIDKKQRQRRIAGDNRLDTEGEQRSQQQASESQAKPRSASVHSASSKSTSSSKSSASSKGSGSSKSGSSSKSSSKSSKKSSSDSDSDSGSSSSSGSDKSTKKSKGSKSDSDSDSSSSSSSSGDSKKKGDTKSDGKSASNAKSSEGSSDETSSKSSSSSSKGSSTDKKTTSTKTSKTGGSGSGTSSSSASGSGGSDEESSGSGKSEEEGEGKTKKKQKQQEFEEQEVKIKIISQYKEQQEFQRENYSRD